MRIVALKKALIGAYCDLNENHTFAMAAGLSYYFLLSLFPLLILLASLLGYIPIPNLFEELLNLMSRLVPQESMGLVREILKGVLDPPKGGLLSFGLIGTIWVATGGFAAMIDALNTAYDVPETRAFWKTRLLSLGLAMMVGTLVLIGLAVTLVGPQFGEWLNQHGKIGWYYAAVWPTVRWTIIFTSIIFAIELLYFWAPNVKQKFLYTLPGALLACGVWVGASLLLGIYVRDFAQYSKTYGTIGGMIALMVWFFLSSLAILIGAEINNELLKAAGNLLPVKEVAAPLPGCPLEEEPGTTDIDRADSADRAA